MPAPTASPTEERGDSGGGHGKNTNKDAGVAVVSILLVLIVIVGGVTLAYRFKLCRGRKGELVANTEEEDMFVFAGAKFGNNDPDGRSASFEMTSSSSSEGNRSVVRPGEVRNPAFV